MNEHGLLLHLKRPSEILSKSPQTKEAGKRSRKLRRDNRYLFLNIQYTCSKPVPVVPAATVVCLPLNVISASQTCNAILPPPASVAAAVGIVAHSVCCCGLFTCQQCYVAATGSTISGGEDK